MAIKDLMTTKIEESDLDTFGKELQTQLVPALEVMPIKIQQIELNQVRSFRSMNPIIYPSKTPVFTALKVLEYWVKAELASLDAKIDSKSVCMKSRWFGILDDCIFLLKICSRRTVLVFLGHSIITKVHDGQDH